VFVVLAAGFCKGGPMNDYHSSISKIEPKTKVSNCQCLQSHAPVNRREVILQLSHEPNSKDTANRVIESFDDTQLCTEYLISPSQPQLLPDTNIGS
jgi:hypothetical protein